MLLSKRTVKLEELSGDVLLANARAGQSLLYGSGGKWQNQFDGLVQPAGFGYLPFSIGRNAATGVWEAQNADGSAFDLAAYVAGLGLWTGQTYYVNVNTGTDTNNGLTAETAFGSLNKAYSMSDVSTIYIAAGTYLRSSNTAVSPTRNVRVIATGGTARISVHDTLSWTLVGGTTATYQATRSSVGGVFDAALADVDGDYALLTYNASYSSGELTAGTWAQIGSTVYIRTANSRVPDSSVRVYLTTKNAYISENITVYFEGISFEGGQYALQAFNSVSPAKNPVIYAKNCAFNYASGLTQTGNGFNPQGILSGCQGCVAARNQWDGFNYHWFNGVNNQSWEIDCVGRKNGWSHTASDQHNGSTTHDGNKVFRLNGRYFSNQGPNVADVNANTVAWNIACGAYGSVAGTGSTNNGNYYCGDSAVMHLLDCSGDVDVAASGKYGIIVSGGTASVFARRFGGNQRPYVGAGTTLKIG